MDTGSKHFELQRLAEDVLVAVAKDGGAAICNAAVMELGGLVVVFDAFMTPQAARDLKRCSEDIFGCTPQIVINSHYHNDHIWGNQVFAPDSQILSSTRTRELIATEGKEEFTWYGENSAKKLAEHRRKFDQSNDSEERSQLPLWLGYYEGLVEAFPTLSVCMPTITFKDRLEIHGSRHSVELITFEGTHTGSDTVLYLPDSGILMMSDLLFVDFHPYLAEGSPLLLLKALQELVQLKAATFVPGHGPVGTIEDMRAMIGYLEHCVETAQRLTRDGIPSEDRISELAIPEPYRSWGVPQFFYRNMSALCKLLNSPK